MRIEIVEREFAKQERLGHSKLFYFTEVDGIVRQVWGVKKEDLGILCKDLEVSPRNAGRDTDMPIFRLKA